jgi:hypothetical protein
MCDKWNEVMDPDPGDSCWTIHNILKVSSKKLPDGKRSVFFKAQFNDGNKAWLNSDVMRMADPYVVVNHAHVNGYTSNPGFEWIDEYLDAEEPSSKSTTHNPKI